MNWWMQWNRENIEGIGWNVVEIEGNWWSNDSSTQIDNKGIIRSGW